MELIDTHSHIDLAAFADDFREVLTRARQAGVIAQILPGVYRAGWQRILDLCLAENDLYPAIGLHPMYLDHHEPEDLDLLRMHAASGKLKAIGEIGLDYFIKDSDRSAQQELFEAQLHIASGHGLPILLHVRKAHDQVQATIRKRGFKFGGIVHAFSGSLQQAEHYIKLGFLISICGTITYDRATRVRSMAVELPLESLVIETDSPDIPPVAHHGQRNSPEYLPEILSALAELRGESMEKVAKQTTINVRGLLCLQGA
ncbi:MAG TPA: TatD family deoxyribonuclease [Desulfocapsa sulfexigens]|nr:TatD family deoxyribonuclease [Desulfocapsa sulfexigens]